MNKWIPKPKPLNGKVNQYVKHKKRLGKKVIVDFKPTHVYRLKKFQTKVKLDVLFTL